MMNKLNEIPDKNPFKVPENYFEEVNKKIISVTAGNEMDIKKSGFYYRFRPYILIAASVSLLIVLTYTSIKLLIPDVASSVVSEVIYEENYESYIYDIDIVSLEEHTASISISEEGPGVSRTEIIDYLLLENIEISDIYEHL